MGKGEGKGRGKGGLFGLINEVGRCVRCILCMPVFGLIALIVGAVLLVSLRHDGRTENLNLYNDAKTSWNNNFRDAFKQNTVFMDSASPPTTQLSTTTDSDPINDEPKQGDPEWVNYTPFRFHRFAAVASSMNINVKVCGPNSTCPTQSLGAFDSTTTIRKDRQDLNCVQSSSIHTDDCRPYDPTASRWCSCVDACADIGGRWSGSTTSGHCEVTHYLARICAQVDDQNVVVKGCEYVNSEFPFAIYQASQRNTVELLVRSKHDPFVRLQQITSGSLDFGLSQREKALIGIACLGAGGVLFFFPIVAMCFICRSRRNNGSSYASAPSTVTYTTTTVTQAPVAQSHVYVPAQQPVPQTYVPPLAQPAYMQQQPKQVRASSSSSSSDEESGKAKLVNYSAPPPTAPGA